MIVFRSCTPLVLSFLEYFFFQRLFPSFKSFFALILLLSSAIIYCLIDSEFSFSAEGFSSFSWVLIYFFFLIFEILYSKSLISTIPMTSHWGPVYYCNSLSVLPMIVLGYVAGDFDDEVWENISNLSLTTYIVLFFSCLTGTFIGYDTPTPFSLSLCHSLSPFHLPSYSHWLICICCRYSSWLCVRSISATSYALVGVLNKFLTIFLNMMIWDRHSSPLGLIAVSGCLLAGVFYEQAPIRHKGSWMLKFLCHLVSGLCVDNLCY